MLPRCSSLLRLRRLTVGDGFVNIDPLTDDASEPDVSSRAPTGPRDGEVTMDTLTRPNTPYYTEGHEAFRANLRRFVAREIAPFVDEWDEAGGFPRELYRKAAAIGLLGLGFPEEYGGTPGDRFYSIIASQELARAGSGGVAASLMSHTIGAPPIARHGSRAMKERVLKVNAIGGGAEEIMKELAARQLGL